MQALDELDGPKIRPCKLAIWMCLFWLSGLACRTYAAVPRTLGPLRWAKANELGSTRWCTEPSFLCCMTDEKARRREFGDTLSGLVDGRKSGVVEWAWLEESSHRVTHCWKLTSTSQGRKFGLLLDRPSHSSGFSHANSKPRDSGFGIPLIMAFIPDMEIGISVVPVDATMSTLTKRLR